MVIEGGWGVQDPDGGHRSLVVAGRTLLRRLGRSKLDAHVRAMLLARPARGRSLRYATAGNERLLLALAHDPHFCRDTAWGGVLHRGRPSFRELGPGGLHIAVEPHDLISAHLDRETPTVGRGDDGTCLYARSRTVRHIRRDVVPSLGRRPEARAPHRPGRARHRHGAPGPLWRLRSDHPTPRPPAPQPAPAAPPVRQGPARSGRTERGRHPHRGPPPHAGCSTTHQAAANP